ncbi:hypothetical protein SARC_14943 [Sphaeroforma arctica JP610]|uniref:Uncharacterized protein n=1 Tax=Sphaeroforma arctica JP610 TaxID=667725 RepID=A0A0L0F708_9EUKA|nr:hypothetical protein SARC_14943 [Sphaeroforma arctica JP610]KNC72500.1 hypothetical protein SARC_14943 [Sphaeroforma arctica JP610]|eukprot:XP_014146402.1 hypothetical protein SARC_14943 [Sphaeroforma arctica JP610]
MTALRHIHLCAHLTLFKNHPIVFFRQAHLNTKHYGWVTKTLVEWFAPQRLSNSDNYMPLLSYAMDVLLPEVIIRLVRDKNECTYEEAESIMLK